jgi:uncharacterized surface protein with fasciclin (FAS1) repeats
VLLNHVVGARLFKNTIANVAGARMLAGTTTAFTQAEGAWLIQDAKISAENMKADNGIVYTIDKVLLPSE